MANDTNFDRLAAMSDEDVLLALDDIAFAGVFGAEDMDRVSRLGRIIGWLNERRAALQSAICGASSVRKVAGVANGSAAELLAAVTDAAAIAVGKPAAGLVAVVMIRQGLNVLCATQWAGDAE